MDVFDLTAKIGLDKSEYESGLNDAKGSASSFASAVGNGLKTVAKIGATAVAAGAAGVTALVKMGVEGYAQYEQLVGGVETLFKESQDTVMGYAENAYKTAGMSANEYMETVTSFSASLIQSLDGDTAKAAEVGNMAITDMSDNANKMGTSIEMIQNAYNGFAKGNFTMLDNLKLGYGGTQEEMKRLLADAEKISGIKYDISSFADITEAIHVMQEEMGIAGTTAREAATTIEGSLSMMKGAWQNLVVGMADENADMEGLINDFVESTVTVADNIMPRIEQALVGVGQLVEGLAPIIADKLPTLVTSILPSLLNAAVSLVTSVASALPGLLESLLPPVLTAILSIVEAIIASLPMLIKTICSMLPTILPQLINGIIAVIVMLCENFATIIQPIIDMLPDLIISIVDALMDNLPALIEGCVALVIGIVEALPQIMLALIDAIPTIMQSILGGFKAAFPTLWDGIMQVLSSYVGALITYYGGLWERIKEIFAPVVEWFGNLFASIWDSIVSVFSAVGTWVYDNIIAPVAQFFTELWEGIVNAYHTVIDPWIEIFKRVAAIVNEEIVTPIKEFFVGLWNDIVGVFSVVADWFTTNISEPINEIFTGIWNKLKDGASKAWEGIKNVFSSVASFFGDVFGRAWTKVKEVFSKGGKVFDGIKEGIVTSFKTVVNALITGINKVVKLPFQGLNAILDKIYALTIVGVQPFSWLTWRAPIPEIPKLATGLNYVPYDEYPALLHRGEAVLTAAEARVWRNGQMTPAMAGGITINQYIQTVPQTPVEMAAATEAYFEQARWRL